MSGSYSVPFLKEKGAERLAGYVPVAPVGANRVRYFISRPFLEQQR